MSMTVPARIKFWRHAREYNQQELGKLLGVAQSTIADIERGHRFRYLKEPKLGEIAQVLNIPVEYLQENGPDPFALAEKLVPEEPARVG